MKATTDLLRSFPLLASLPRETLDHLSTVTVIEKVPRRGVALDAREEEKSICFLFEGRLQGIDFTVDGREVGLYFVEAGDFCGELSLFDDLAKPELIVALAYSVVAKIPKPEITKIMLGTPSVMNVLANKLATRIRRLTLQRSLLAVSNIQQRVCSQLWLLANEDGRAERINTADHLEIRFPPTHLEIAIMLNISRETVTRVFQTLQNRQIVQRNGSNSLLVTDPERLHLLAQGSD